ncbi:glycosyltransferase family 39 protein [Nitrosomonas mobilis]|uniref:Putative dolichol monophosphate mannose synthase n=1 Tax=Nitrosomonas mobilis TaxID=51642 RepID=A0A1G5SAW8_9PROT|nr:glycosyltransferase family 39 protein [Nitrosomonas mobilis]SCZ84343.1 putative dolichol monophosphate mannose synthase [Nitrosomonas mobilis]HNO75949.1 glycosyltransferase family 39 protein [Nitrosomonas mobilis]
MQFSLIIPTLNEAVNIDPLLTSLFSLNSVEADFEVIIVDDGSTDGTQTKIAQWATTRNVKLIERHASPDLTASILEGVRAASHEVIAVMDADLSHPPEQLINLVQPVMDGSHDIVIGSRYVTGGSTENWPFYRRWLSRAGGWLARVICDVNDATSGFFAFRKELVQYIPEKAHGYKILLELIMSGQGKLRIKEIPICFRDRTRGSSKLSFGHNLIYLQRLITLAGGTASVHTASRFAFVGFLGVFVDVLIFQLLISQGIGLALAHMSSFVAAATFNYTLNSKWSFRIHHDGQLRWKTFLRFLTIGLFSLLLRGGVLAWLIYTWNIPVGWAIFPAIVIAALVNYLGSAFYVFPRTGPAAPPDIRWRTAAVGVIGFAILLRFVYLGVAQLIPDEAYYWQYAQHMGLSFYDHPPMVAWLIWLGTALFGQNEFGVRIGAFICGLIAIAYLYAFARNLYDKPTAMCATMLFVVVPFGFVSGLAMLPDAPLIAAWIATLYYLERALLANKNLAWIGAGIAFGLGILSKYTLGLLGFAVLAFVLLDPVSRRWLGRPHPYLATAIALLMFSPVIIWNMEHEWVSFLFQTGRISGDQDGFSTHKLIAYIAVILTPVGFLAAILALYSVLSKSDKKPEFARKNLFVGIFTGIPLLIFLVLSTYDTPRFHWNSPLWLALLPTMAWIMGQQDLFRKASTRLRAAWQPTIVISLMAYAFVLHYATLGIPGLPYQFLNEHYFWKETTAEIEKIADEIKQQTGEMPVIIGLSKWSIASALTFYSHHPLTADIRSRNVFGEPAVMYDYWQASGEPIHRPILMVGMRKRAFDELTQQNDSPEASLIAPGEINSRIIYRYDGTPLRKVYYRIAQGYLGNSTTRQLSDLQNTAKSVIMPKISAD